MTSSAAELEYVRARRYAVLERRRFGRSALVELGGACRGRELTPRRRRMDVRRLRRRRQLERALTRLGRIGQARARIRLRVLELLAEACQIALAPRVV